MKTFEQEYNELINWMKKKNQEDSEARNKDTVIGKDGELTYARQQVVKEYNRRLVALMKKYGKETTPSKDAASRKGAERVHI